jgi:hypothetical protein
VPTLDSNRLAASSPWHRPRPALSLFLALTAGVVAVIAVRSATSPGAKTERERRATEAPAVDKNATVSLARRTFPVH